ncbi:MAG: putative transport protein YhhT [Bacteroidota bacterium]|jgi:predicted PurR-regulated permease PerM
MSETLKHPFYIKLAGVLLCLISLFVIVYFGQDIISPLLLSLLFAIILRPIVVFLTRRLRFPYFIAVVFAISVFVLLFAGILYFISLQIGSMASDWDNIKDNLYFHFQHLQEALRDNFNLSKQEQNEIINNAKMDSLASGKQLVGSTLSSFTDIILNLALIPVYTFLFLLYQNLFVTFLIKLYQPQHHQKLRTVLVQIKLAVQSYVVGLLFEMVAVSLLTTLGLYLIGVPYFILLGIITGILNLVPYIGILFAGALSIAVSLTGSTDLTIIVGVIVVNVVVQLIDNNLLVPLFVNSKVQINALVSIVGIIVGNVLGGITGMFLAIPIIAIIKVIFDRIESLEPWGYLMGDDLPKTFEWHKIKIPSYQYDHTADTNNFSSTIVTEDSEAVGPKELNEE